jgi:saccharopine dehydrogenase-like NADP-dependent oxidoreductase
VTAAGLSILVLGATGAMGRRTAAELARAPEVDRVVVAGRRRPALDELHRFLGGPNGKAEPVLLRSPDAGELAGLFARVDAVASCVGPAGLAELAFVDAALAARVPYTSLCDDPRVTRSALELDATARADGPTVVLGCGLRPGITNLLFELAAREMDSVASAAIAVAGSVSSEEGPASELHYLRCLDDDVAVLSDGRLEINPAGSSPHLVFFPDPVGWVETFPCAHPEVFTLRRPHPDVRNLEWRFGLVEKPAMDALRAAAAMGVARSDGRSRRWLRVSASVRPLLERFASGRGGWSAARVDVWGARGGRPSEVSLAVVDHLSNLVSLPLAHVAVELAAKRVDKPGVWAPDEVLAPSDVLAHLARRGVRIARLQPAVV